MKRASVQGNTHSHPTNPRPFPAPTTHTTIVVSANPVPGVIVTPHPNGFFTHGHPYQPQYPHHQHHHDQQYSDPNTHTHPTNW